LVTINTFTILLKSSKIDQTNESIIFAWRGEVHRLINQYENALKDFNRAIQLNSSYKWALVNRGRTYRLMERYDEALKDFNHAIELDPEYDRAIANRGRTHRLMERYDKALKDFNRAIELDPEYDWAIANRAATYQALENYDEAFADISYAIVLAPNNKWYLQQRAWLQQTPDRYEQSIEDFDCLIKLDPGNISYITGRGLILLLHGSYERALEDWNHAIQLHENSWIYCYRALTHFYLKRNKQAKKDINQAINLAQEQYDKDPSKHYNTCNLGLYYLIVSRLNDAKFFYREAVTRGIPISILKESIEDLNRLSNILPNHPHMVEMREFIKSQLDQRQNQARVDISQEDVEIFQKNISMFRENIYKSGGSDTVDEYY
ncbi:tetratricopeptide repeat protein, partial [Leptolyngbya cf. ectocarpi LEGE 11479]